MMLLDYLLLRVVVHNVAANGKEAESHDGGREDIIPWGTNVWTREFACFAFCRYLPIRYRRMTEITHYTY